MIKSTKKAFTLVELIVVITILAILGTIAFISLQGYSADARNTKRTNDVASIAQKISIEIAKGIKALDFSVNTGVTTCTSSGMENSAGTGVNFTKLNESEASFKDPKGCSYNYVFEEKTVTGTTITGESTNFTEQLYEVYTWKEGVATTTGFISAGRTLSGHIVPASW